MHPCISSNSASADVGADSADALMLLNKDQDQLTDLSIAFCSCLIMRFLGQSYEHSRIRYNETVLCIDTLVYSMVCNIRRLSQLNGPFFTRRFINIVLRSETTNEKKAFVLKIHLL